MINSEGTVFGEARRRSLAPVILLCFFASGASGLIYQVVWVRELVLIFGATTFAASTVLTAFMGGLALGSYYFGRRTQRLARPLKMYGFLELGIGVYGLLVPMIFAALPSIYQPVWQQIHLSFVSLTLFRFGLVAVVLLIPTALMGATLPVLASYYARGSHRIGLKVGRLYSLNTFGAVMGAGLSGFVLIPAVGMRLTTIVAAAINLILGAVALGVDSSVQRLPEPSSERAQSNPGKPRSRLPGRERATRPAVFVVLFAFAVSGFVALAYEVIWSRVLALIIGSSVYAFSIMLTTFLIGLALGASIASHFVDRIRRPLIAFAFIESGVGLLSLAGAAVFNELPYAFVVLYKWFESSGFGLMLFARFLVASLVMIGPTLLLGALFPLVVRIVYGGTGRQTAADPSLGKAVGNTYAVNTVGAIAGAFLSGFALIPTLGLLGTLRLSVALNFVVATVLFLSRASGLSRAIGGLISAGLLLIVLFFEPPWDVAIMSSGVYRYAPAMRTMNRGEFLDYFRQGNQGETLYYKEGITTTVAVQKQTGGRVLKVNGKPDASTGADLPTQVLIGGLPLLARSQTDNVLVIGLGSGVTLGTIERFPIKQLTCVELEPAVIEASHFFDDVNNRPLEDPRLRLIANDGRNYIETTAEKFDVIVSEPSNPWLTGAANLFTLEYFKHGADRLRDNGIFSQWLQIYEMPPDDVKSLVATFSSAFPYVAIFRAVGSDLMLLGSKQPIQLDLKALDSHFGDPRISAELNRVKVRDIADLLSYYYFGPEGTAKFAAGAPLNTDDNALIEFRSPRRVGIGDETVQSNLRELLACARDLGHPIPKSKQGWWDPEHSEVSPLLNGVESDERRVADFLLEVALGAIKRDDTGRAEHFVEYSLALLETARGFSIRGEIHHARNNNEAALGDWNRAIGLESTHFYTLVDLGKYYLIKQDLPAAASYLDRAIEVNPASARAHHLRGLVFQSSGDAVRAAAQYRLALPDREYTRNIDSFFLNFGTALAASGLYEEAAQMLEEHVQLRPLDIEGHYQLGAVCEVASERSLDDRYTYRAIDALKRALTLSPTHAMSHYYLSKALRRLGRYAEADVEFELYERHLAR